MDNKSKKSAKLTSLREINLKIERSCKDRKPLKKMTQPTCERTKQNMQKLKSVITRSKNTTDTFEDT